MEVTKFALEEMTVHLRQRTLTALGGGFASGRGFVEALRGSKSLLRKLAAISRDAVVATNAKITRQLLRGLRQVAIHLQQAQNILMRLGKSVASKPTKLKEVLRARENDLQRLLVNSPEAVLTH